MVPQNAAPTQTDPAAPNWSQPLHRWIGAGGFASVWEIPSGGVLKVAHADHELARARMRREAEALSAIGPPAVPRLHDSGVLADGRAWIAMDRVDGTNLADVIAAGQMRIDQAIALGVEILVALARVHAAGFAHRDLKPDNLVRDGERIVILDLGLARKLPDDPDDPTRAGVQVGSLEYMPPEQLLDAATAGPRADIYAFGCVLYELCTGRPPFVGDAMGLQRAHAALRPPPLAALAVVPPPLEALVHDCLSKLPDRRPQSVTELRARLSALRDATPSLQRVQHSASVIREGKQPVVLLWAELPKVDRSLLGSLASRKITVISQRGRRVLGAAVGADHADPASAAVAAARDLATAGARVALHLDAVAVVTGPSGTAITGVTEAWLPQTTWTGIVISRALAAVLQTPTRATELPGFVMLGEPSQTAQLFGRDALVTELATDAAAALAKQGPALALVLGDPGIGKTALADALVPQLRDLGARVHVGEVPPPGSTKSGALAGLIGTPSGMRAIGDALRDAARAQPTAIIVDNVHLADADFLDALEYATLGGEALALWILVLATPRLEQRRPGFGARAERHHRVVVPPLDEDASVALATELLKPVEYPPLRALRKIASIAHGNPLHLSTLVREIARSRGAIRVRPNGEHFLDTSALDALPPVALGPWLAARELAHLGVEQAALARVCAVLGDRVGLAELHAVVDAVERRGGATTTLDVDVGLHELRAAGIVVPAGEGVAFRQPLLQEGIYATTDETERRAIHVAALEHWRGQPDAAEQIARHAEAVGERATAAAAFAALGERAAAEHHELEAAQAWEGALRNLTDGDALLPHALLGRGRARYRSQRRIEALADFAQVEQIAIASDDRTLEVAALLEQATVHDWTGSFEQSRVAAERARKRAIGVTDSLVLRNVDLAHARGRYRALDFDAATPALDAVAEASRIANDPETEIVARLVLSLVLVDVGKLDAAELQFERLLALCKERNDRFHLASTLINRARLWSGRGRIDLNAADMREVIQLSREGGQAQLERMATYNFAEDLLWQGALDEALRLARRSLALQSGQGEGSAGVDQVLVARILAARHDRATLREALAGIDDSEELAEQMGGAKDAIIEALRAAAGMSPWSAALASSNDLPTPMQIEVGLLAGADGQLPSDRRAVLVELAKVDPNFASRLREL
jgi:eukaryotic-like serine/threonine-protein kinase